MTYTKEDVKRLVPEAELVWNTFEGVIHVKPKGIMRAFPVNQMPMKDLLKARRQLEIAREALDKLTLSELWGDIAREAIDAIDAIEKEGKV